MQSFMITMLSCSAATSLPALFYMALMPLLAKRYSEKGCYYAWLIIVFGLIIPFRPQFNNAIVKVDVPSERSTPIIRIGNGSPVAVPDENTVNPLVSATISWWQVVAAIWLAGAIIYIVYHIVKHYHFMKMAKRWSENVTDNQTIDLLQDLKSEMGISRQINLYLCSSIGSPMMVGFINSRILLPKADIAQDELRLILKHELVHYKRKDLYYKCLVLIAAAIHWFNPIVYLIANAINMQCELSCDAEVVQSADMNTRQHYSKTIIGIVKYQSKMKTALSTNFYGGKKSLKKRILSIMDMSKKKIGLLITCCVFIAVLGTGMVFAVNANASTGFHWSFWEFNEQKAEEYTKDVTTEMATVTAETLKVRLLPSYDAKVYALVPEDENLDVVKKELTEEYIEKFIKLHEDDDFYIMEGVDKEAMLADLDNWICIKINDEKAFVRKEFVELSYKLEHAGLSKN